MHNWFELLITIIACVNFLLLFVESIISLSDVVKPVPVNIEIVWNLALSNCIPSILKIAEKISIIAWYIAINILNTIIAANKLIVIHLF